MRTHGLFTAPALLLALASTACSPNQHAYSTSPVTQDYATLHPIQVRDDVVTREVEVDRAGRPSVTRERLQAFVSDYSRRGHGPIEMRGSPRSLKVVGMALMDSGATLSDLNPRVVPGMRDGVSLMFQVSVARAPSCGSFSSDMEQGSSNFWNGQTTNFGCASQRNLANMAMDPLDLVRPREMPGSTSAAFPSARIRDTQTYVAPVSPIAGGTNQR